MPVVAGAIVPHAPALTLRSVRLGPSAERLRTAATSLTFDDCDVLVMVSPHGRATGVYSGVMGSLDGFGVRGMRITSRTDLVLADELAREWERPFLEPPVDHGITAAMLPAEMTNGRAVVAVTLATTTGPGAPGTTEDVLEEATALAGAVAAISSHRIGFVASAHTSAALSPGAPLLDRPEGHALEERVLAALADDVGDLARIEADLWRAAGACGAGPLSALGILFAGHRVEVGAYETPAGVGYLVAQVVRP